MDGLQRHCVAVAAGGFAAADGGAGLARRALELALHYPTGAALQRAVSAHVLHCLAAADCGPGVLALAAAYAAPLAAGMAEVLGSRLEGAAEARRAGEREAGAGRAAA
jgi:hypothetical protein